MDERLTPLANVARDLPDKDLEEIVIFAAYLKYRRRVIDAALKTFSSSRQSFCFYCNIWYTGEHDCPSPLAAPLRKG